MFINELLENDIIVISATDSNNHTIKMETSIAGLESKEDFEYLHSIKDRLQGFKYAVVQPLKSNNKVINFNRKDVNCSAVGVHDKKAYSWDKVVVLKVRLPIYGVVHIVVSDDKAVSFNRRSEYRLPLRVKATVMLLEQNNKKVEAVTHDISEHGIGFIVESDIQIPLHSKVLVSFNANAESFSLLARVIRSVPVLNDSTMFGCMITGDNDGIPEFIYEQQRLQIRK